MTGSEPITPVVRALATDGTRLFLGGSFDSAGGHPANSVAVYTPGAGFAALAGGVQTCVACGSNVHPGLVTALRWTGNRLWIGGAFESAGPVSTYSFASWAAGTWTGYGTGLTQSGSQGTVQSLAVDSATGNVYAGGRFDSAGTGSAAGIAQLSHGAWSAIGDITAGGGITDVSGLAVLGGVLYATGSFTTAGGVSVHDFAARTGTTWTQVGGGLDQPGAALAPYGAGVLVAGGFDKTSNSAVQLPALGWWTGRWQTLGQGPQQANNIPAIVQALASDGGKGVYVGGKFSQVGAVAASDIAQWTGTAWHALGTGMSLGGGAGGLVQAMARYGGKLYVAGQFDHAGGVPANNIASWDGTSWHALAGGLTGGLGRCNSLVVIGGKLYAAGGFGNADGHAVGAAAVWDPATSTWAALPGNPSFDGDIFASAASGNHLLYLGGNYADLTVNKQTKLASGLVSFDTKATGSGLDRYVLFGGTNGVIETMSTSAAGDLYVGGAFAGANAGQGRVNVPANNVAVWRGSTDQTWHPLGAGTDGLVGALTLSGSQLYVGGSFAHAGGATNSGIAAVNPTSGAWASMGVGGVRGPASSATYTSPQGNALLPDAGGGVWLGGQFVQVANNATASSFGHWLTIPTISSFTPSSGAAGSSVTIAGTNLDNATGVSFSGTAASFTRVSASRVDAIVPAGASTGPISITTPEGIARSTAVFTVT